MGRILLLPVFGMLMYYLLLVIVRDLDIVGITIDEPEANAPLIIDMDRVLSLPVSPELMEPIAARNLKIVYSRCQAHVLKLSPRPPSDVRRKLFRPPGVVKLLRPRTGTIWNIERVSTHATITNRNSP